MTTDLTALATRLHQLADLLNTAGHLALTRAAEHTPGIPSGWNTTGHTPGISDPTATTALAQLDDTTALDQHLRSALADLDHTTRRTSALIDQAITVHRRDTRPTVECGEALCTEAATPGRLGYCQTDYDRRRAWVRDHGGTIHQAPPLTRQTLADRAIRKRKTHT